MSDITFLRTSVITKGCGVDMQVPSHEPVSTTIREIIEALEADFISKGRDTTWLLDRDASWTLELFGRRQLDSNKSLADQGVYNGTRLYLVKNASNESYAMLNDDLAEAVATGGEKFAEWRFDVAGVRFATWALAALFVVLSLGVAGAVGWAFPSSLWVHVGAAAALTVVAAIMTSLAVPLSRSGNSTLATALALSAYSTVAAASFVAIPRPPGLWHVVVMSAAVLTFAIAFRIGTPSLIEVNAAVMAAMIPILAVGVLNIIYLWSPAVIGAQVVMIASLVFLYSSGPAMTAGKIETPYVHTAGEGVSGDEDPIYEVNRRFSGREAKENVINQAAQVEAAHRYMVGLIFGSCATMIAGAFFLGYGIAGLERHYWVAMAFASLVSVCVFNRGRNYRHTDARTIIYTSAGLIALSYLLGLLVSDPLGNKFQIIAMAAGATLYVIVGALWALSLKTIRSPVVRKRFEVLDAALYVTLIPLLGALMDAWTMVRNR